MNICNLMIMKIEKFKQVLEEINSENKDIVSSLFNEETDNNVSSIETDTNPKDLSLDDIIVISQKLNDGKIKQFEFIICEVWLKPTNMWTIVNVKKDKLEKNFWILFYDNGTYYLKKGIKGPIGVHVKLNQKSEEK